MRDGPINFSEFPPPLTLYILNCIMTYGLCSAMYFSHLVLCFNMICLFVVSINIYLTWLDFELKTRACTSNQAYHALHEFDGTTRDLYVPRPNGRGSMTGPRTCLISPKKTVCIGSLLIISMLWHRLAILKSKEDKLCSSAECMIRTQCTRYQIASKTQCSLTNWLSYRGSS